MGLFDFGKKHAESVVPGKTVTLSDGETHEVSMLVDCVGDSCPRPQMMTKKALKAAAVGEVIGVILDNPTSVEAIEPMLDNLDASHLETVKADRCWEIYIRKD